MVSLAVEFKPIFSPDCCLLFKVHCPFRHRPDVAIHACLFQVRRVSSTSCLPGHLKADRHVAQCMRWISKDDHGVQCPLEEVQGRSAGVHPLSMTMAAATNIVLEAGLGLRRVLGRHS